MSNSAGVARCAPLASATRNSEAKGATGGATHGEGQNAVSPMTGRELRAQLRAQLGRNTPATSGPSQATESCASLQAANDPQPDDPAIERRRQRVLELLDRHQDWHYAFVAVNEPGSVIVHVGIRGLATGEIVIDEARYDAAELMRCFDRAGAQNLISSMKEQSDYGI